MKKKISALMICVYILMLSLSLVGCGNQPAAPTTALGIVIAPTACSQGLNLSSPLIEETVGETILNYGRICVICADSVPEVVADADFNISEQYKNASKSKLTMDARSKTTNFLNSMNKVIADDEEVDFLKSIQLCARNLAALEGYDNKIMIIVGTGLSTTGVLNFRNNLLLADSMTIADAVEAQGEIPTLNEVQVYWQQLGDTAAPQAELNGQQRQALEDIWGEIIRRGGGDVVFNEVMYTDVSSKTEFPHVSTVNLPVAPVIGFEAEQTSSEEVAPFSTPISFPDTMIRFEPDSDRYVDEAAVKEALAPVAEILIANPDTTVLLCGCIAGDKTSEFGMNLSRQRAEAVRQTLMELSVPEAQMLAKGLGTENPWHISADFSDDLSAQNRRVVLVNVQTELGQELLNR